MKVLVLGGTGYIGRELLAALLGDSRVDIVCSLSRAPALGPPPAFHAKLLPLPLDLARGQASLRAWLSSWNPDVIIHAAGPPGETRCLADVLAAHACHVETVQTICMWQTGPPEQHTRLIYLSSLLRSGLYGALKLVGEAVTLTGERNCALRLGSVYGDGRNDGVVSRFVRAAVHGGGASIMGTGMQTLPLVHVHDVVRVVLRHMYDRTRACVEQVYQSQVSVRGLQRLVRSIAGRSSGPVTYVPDGHMPVYEIDAAIPRFHGCGVALEDGIARAVRIERVSRVAV